LLSFCINSQINAATGPDIIAQVQEQLNKDPRTANLPVNVEIAEVVLSLKGQVPTQEEANILVEVASSVAGVKDVDTTKLTTEKSHQLIADSIITAKVKGLFIREKLLGTMPVTVTGIHVETKDGVVYLTGIAKTKEQVSVAEKLAGSVMGVKHVSARIKIE
jgi:hyperosmotically inducible protein